MTTQVTERSAAQPVGPPPPFDPELAPVLEVLSSLRPPDAYRPDNIVEMRKPVPGVEKPTDEVLSRGGAYSVRERVVPGPAGQPDVSLLICLPKHAETPTSAIYHVHGGGMIVENNRFGLAEMLDLAEPLGMAVVSVEYRLAPETPHPGPVEDCYAGLVWTAEHADELNIDPARIVVGGASAGGGLAAGVTLMARDRTGPAVLAQLLLSPMLDDRNDSPSAHQMRGLGIWDSSSNETGWNALLGDGVRGGPDVSPYAAPARAADLSGLPSTFIDVGSAETFRDEDVAHASRMWQAGCDVELHVWPGGFHGFDVVVPGAVLSQDAIAARAAWLRRQLRGSRP
ncbi:alpha/beta hydrolase fold domain-containing protein [Lentzea sp. NBRC 102530]|uniref:alpha/beta hydrolase n=1 Tax=Lentzea sp. NBRC 102530 TaxID=3032201 RepID=UPI0024A04013|nr:alpha/beta hydrolase fold domain-containing protein [Lentzea sp. NBRC 102530]GLY52174.1 esterase [Lentzea sp. NBRC 102530]